MKISCVINSLLYYIVNRKRKFSKKNMQFWTFLYFSGRYFCMLYDHILWLIRPTMPLRHRRSALRLFGSYRWRGTKGAPWRRMTRENHAANPPSMARHYSARKNKVSLPCLTRQSVRTYSDMFCAKKSTEGF